MIEQGPIIIIMLPVLFFPSHPLLRGVLILRPVDKSLNL